ncbi:carbohydrate sulfotransferase 11-like [Microplitis mediator]|uniref:carbohydrate sulfotransferase 11-like n=1 Tax=Microplitis mediator TaxID=375433 RepID=UPI002556D7D5|nr:carbohydrate sulfotransferase 11-like [Microplitis mediator]
MGNHFLLETIRFSGLQFIILKNMNFKKYFIKYSSCIFIYILFCIALIIFKISYVSSRRDKTPVDNFESLVIVNEDNDLNNFEEKLTNSTVDPLIVDEAIQRVYSVCEKYNRSTALERMHYFYSPKHSSLFCWIRKVASTSFTKLFADLRDIKVIGNYYKQIEVLVPESIEEFLNLIDDTDVFKFIAVRHPFDRLVSAYRSRIADNSRHTSQAWIFVPRIFYITRPQLFHFNKTTGTPLEQIFYNDRRLKLIPTFKEFITWLLEQPDEQDDPHWSKYQSHCSICQMPFDYIIKLDNYTTSDVNYLFTKLGLNKNQWTLPRLGQSHDGMTTYARTCNYLSTLSIDMFYKLFERYKIDFEMFDYDYSTYKSCINK